MKKFYACILTVCLFTLASAQGTWTRKSDIPVQRQGAVSFTIGTKCYVLTGGNFNGVLRDFWEWDPATNIWVQKATFPGTPRYFASGFALGNKGYITLGFSGIQSLNDLWEWDSSTDTWTQKANFPGTARHHSSSFSIGDKGYIGTGWSDAGDELKDFWEWDSNSEQWTQKTDFGGSGRQGATAFAIGAKGYIGLGEDHFSSYATFPSVNDFWEWDQATDTWARISDFAGTGRYHALGFSIGSKGYVGLGKDYNGGPDFFSDIWEWDQSSGLWSQISSPAANLRWLANSFVIGNKGYIGFGGDTLGGMMKDFWEFEPAGTAGVKEVKSFSFCLFPNPNTGSFNIRTDIKSGTIDIFNSLGLLIHSGPIRDSKTSIDLPPQPGVYFCRIYSEGITIPASRFVVE
jgi:N-acetylneuraminic acid mutarotase